MKRKARGSAMILTLLLVVAITVLAIGFITSMRLESLMARSHLNGLNADFIAEMGTDAALARLQTAIGSTNGSSWVTQPGLVTVGTSAVDLSSGFSSSTNSADTVNLNVPELEDSTKYAIAYSNNFVDPTASQMRLKWIYVNKDGTYAGAGTTNSVGRFAFWTDDESAKANINTAWQRGAGNTNSLSDPSQVGLATLGFPDANAVQTNRPFNTVQEARRIANAGPVIDTNSFSLSAYNHSPDLNMFNEPRIILTTQQSLAGGGTNFIDILNSPNTDPGLAANLNPTKVKNQVNKLTAILQRTNWPLPSLAGASFAAKYSPVRPQQLAVDLIEYVRSRESTSESVEPIFGYMSANSFVCDESNLGDVSEMEGNARAPRITEMGVYVSSPFTSGTNKVVQADFYMEVYLPAHYGLSQVDLTKYNLGTAIDLNGTNTAGAYYSISGPISPNQSVINTGSLPISPLPTAANPSTITNIIVYNDGSANYTQLQAGGYRKIIGAALFASTNRNDLSIGSFRAGLRDAANVRVELVPASASLPIAYTVDGASVAEASITTAQARDDPCVNKFYGNWTQTRNTFGAPPITSTLGHAPSVPAAQQDTDSSGNLTDVGMVFPARKGTAGNLSGIMQSPGEIGYVHTGIESTVNGVSWRTVRLQPQTTSTNLPDWALADIFSVSIATNSYFVNPTATNSSYLTPGGKVNLNAEVKPFVDGSSNDIILRLLPIQAVFNGASTGTTNLSSSAAANLSTNIYSHALAQHGSFYGASNYLSPGQIAEIQGVADSGESSETLLVNTLGLMTSRSGVFSIYAVGQSIHQSVNGTVTILGEHRDLTMVEQVQSGTRLIFRPVFSKQISP